MSEKEYKNVNTARRAAVSGAWKKERELVLEGKGTRDWSKAEQKEIIKYGKCSGYFGHHKYTVKSHPEEAGNINNIQFLTKDEHLRAHDGDYKNDPHGRYDYSLNKIEKYEGRVKSEPVHDLSKRLNKSDMNASLKEYADLKEEKQIKMREARDAAKRKATKYEQLPVNKRQNEKSRNKTELEGEGTPSAKDKRAEAAKRREMRGTTGETTSVALSKSRLEKSGRKGESDRAITNGKIESVALSKTRSEAGNGEKASRGNSIGNNVGHGHKK